MKRRQHRLFLGREVILHAFGPFGKATKAVPEAQETQRESLALQSLSLPLRSAQKLRLPQH